MANMSISKKNHRVCVYLCAHHSLASYGLVLDTFRAANFVSDLARFCVSRISQDGAAVAHPDGRLAVDGGLSLLDKCEVLIIPSLWAQGPAAVAHNRAFIERLATLSPETLVLTLCTGGYLLAASGRLDQRQATTHWFLADAFQQSYPDVKLQVEAGLTHDGNFICSGGAMAAADACLYVVQLLAGRQTAKELARMLVTDVGRQSQAFYAPQYALRRHADRAVMALERHIETHYADNLTLEDLAQRIHASVRTLQRRFRTATGMTPIQYQQMVRIECAKDLLETETSLVQEIARRVGYQDRVAFGRVFKKATGVTPDAYRQRYLSRATRTLKNEIGWRDARAARIAEPA